MSTDNAAPIIPGLQPVERVSPDKASAGFIEVGKWQHDKGAYQFEAVVDLYVDAQGTVWARVCGNINELPDQEG